MGLGRLGILSSKSLQLQKFADGVNVSTQKGDFREHFPLVLKTVNKTHYGGTRAFSGQWTSGKSAFAAFDFKTNTTAGADTDYGWIRLVYDDGPNDGAPDSITAIDWAYGANGTPITTGETPTPEPSAAALSLLASGAMGIIALRRRRSQAA